MRRRAGSVLAFLWVLVGFSLYPILSIKTKCFDSPYARSAFICVVIMGGVIIRFMTGDELPRPLHQSNPPLSLPEVDKIAVDVEIGVFSYRRDGGEGGQKECIVCLCEYEEDDQVVALAPCQHNFHVDCIRKWLQCKLRCPICNAPPLQKFGSLAQNLVTLQNIPALPPVAH